MTEPLGVNNQPAPAPAPAPAPVADAGESSEGESEGESDGESDLQFLVTRPDKSDSIIQMSRMFPDEGEDGAIVTFWEAGRHKDPNDPKRQPIVLAEMKESEAAEDDVDLLRAYQELEVSVMEMEEDEEVQGGEEAEERGRETWTEGEKLERSFPSGQPLIPALPPQPPSEPTEVTAVSMLRAVIPTPVVTFAPYVAERSYAGIEQEAWEEGVVWAVGAGNRAPSTADELVQLGVKELRLGTAPTPKKLAEWSASLKAFLDTPYARQSERAWASLDVPAMLRSQLQSLLAETACLAEKGGERKEEEGGDEEEEEEEVVVVPTKLSTATTSLADWLLVPIDVDLPHSNSFDSISPLPTTPPAGITSYDHFCATKGDPEAALPLAIPNTAMYANLPPHTPSTITPRSSLPPAIPANSGPNVVIQWNALGRPPQAYYNYKGYTVPALPTVPRRGQGKPPEQTLATTKDPWGVLIAPTVEEVVPIVEVARGDVDGEGDGKVGSDDEEISGGEAEARMREGRGRTKKVAEKIVEKPVAKVTTKGFPMERNEGLLGEDWLEQVVWDVETRTSPPRRAPLLLDANDRNMIFADEEEYNVNSDDEDLTSAEKLLALSKDEHYKQPGDVVMGQIHIRHSEVAEKLLPEYYRPYMPRAELQQWHRPLMQLPQNVALTVVPPEDGGTREPGWVPRRPRDLSDRPGEELVLLEYLERHPPLLSNAGMCSKLMTYYRKEELTDAKEPTPEYGDVLSLTPSEGSPFPLGDVQPGQSITSVNNRMFVAPVVRHEAPATDFLLVCRPGGKGWTVRPLPSGLFVVGQQQPKVRVPNPAQKDAHETLRKRMAVVRDRALLDATEESEGKLDISVLKDAFVHGSREERDRFEKLAKRVLRETMSYSQEERRYVQFEDSALPSEERLRSLCPPEDAVAYESMQEGRMRLQALGLKRFEEARDELVAVVEKLTVPAVARVARYIIGELQMAPWSTSQAMQMKANLTLTGRGNPFASQPEPEGFSLVTQSKRKDDKEDEDDRGLGVPNKAVASTSADLRKLTMEELRRLLVNDLGVPDKDVPEERWVRVGYVRTKINEAVAAGRCPHLQKFRRTIKVSGKQVEHKYRSTANEILERQLVMLAEGPREESGYEDPYGDDDKAEEDGKEGDGDEDDESEEAQYRKMMQEMRGGGAAAAAPVAPPPPVVKAETPQATPQGTPLQSPYFEGEPGSLRKRKRTKLRKRWRLRWAKEMVSVDGLVTRVEQTPITDEEALQRFRYDVAGMQRGFLGPNDVVEEELRTQVVAEVRRDSASRVTDSGKLAIRKNYMERAESEGFMEAPGTPAGTPANSNKFVIDVRGVRQLTEAKRRAEQKAKRLKQQRTDPKFSQDYLKKPAAKRKSAGASRRKGDPRINFNGELSVLAEELRNLPQFAVFRDPVSHTNYPAYRQRVTRPMDLRTLKSRCDNAAKGYGSRRDFVEDVDLIYRASAAFNGEASPITDLARQLGQTARDWLDRNREMLDVMEQEVRTLDSYRRLNHHIRAVVAEVEKEQYSKAFINGVSSAVKDYYKQVKDPIALCNMRERANARNVLTGYTAVEQFDADLALMVANSEAFNGPAHPLSQNAKRTRKRCLDLLNQMLGTPGHIVVTPAREGGTGGADTPNQRLDTTTPARGGGDTPNLRLDETPQGDEPDTPGQTPGQTPSITPAQSPTPLREAGPLEIDDMELDIG